MPRLASCRLIVFAVVILLLGLPTFVRAQKDAGTIVGEGPDWCAGQQCQGYGHGCGTWDQLGYNG